MLYWCILQAALTMYSKGFPVSLQVLDFHTYWSPLTGICLLGPESFEDGLKFATGGVFLLPLENAAATSAFFSPKSRLSQVQRWRKRDNWVPRAERSVDFSLGGGHALCSRKSTVWASNIFSLLCILPHDCILQVELIFSKVILTLVWWTEVTTQIAISKRMI